MEIIRGKIDITAFLFNKVRKNYNLRASCNKGAFIMPKNRKEE